MLEDLYRLVKDITNFLLGAPLGVVFVIGVLCAYGILNPAHIFPWFSIYIVLGFVKDYHDFMKRREQEDE